jgi:methylmalonyl-CoA mutase cobalamin-binding domain/chain
MAELSELAQALADLNEERVNTLVEARLKAGVAALDIIEECNAGMAEIGERFAASEYFLSELIYSAEILKGVMARLEPLLESVDLGRSVGTVVIGTVKGDIHDIGKNVVVTLLRGTGFEVFDLGVDVPAEAFVEKVKKTGAKVLGLSALLNLAYPEMKNVVDKVTAAGIRDQVTIIIGGAPINEQVREYTAADYWAPDAPAAVKICKQVYSESCAG